MPVKPPPPRRQTLTGTRIRERRLAQAVRQGDLAQMVGISASYLNLIEHNRRRIGGKLLLDIAKALQVEPARLSQGMDATLQDMLQAAARKAGPRFGPPPETARIDELAGRFPGWTGLIADQQKRIAALEAAVEGLQDRLGHDPVLAGSMHEVLSTVAAIRSTSDILVREADLDPVWRGRFHRNLHEEAERLSLSATDLLAHFEGQGARKGVLTTPQEQVEAAFEQSGHHFPGIEAEGAAAIPAVLDTMETLQEPSARALAEQVLTRYAEDAARLPFEGFLAAAAAAAFEPQALLAMAGGDAALLLRRLATLPEGGSEAVPAFGLAICDASGALLFRRRISAFSIPRYGSGCPLWPMYRALGRPMVPDSAVLDLPEGGLFRAWAVSQPVGPAGFGGAPVLEATMLLRALPEDEATVGETLPVGPGCALCPREACPARRAEGRFG
ncbi:helix-turn-helix transcriptional regulator [Nioella nitratireducens]|uniref:helix-turn-helix transcriptional regulator n=1 Tax=Nioella nitratireducens TaxID=1287720 RepID=UPI0008FD4F2E|nr:helix-turn-helix transcriptional regulator [Nioella nitratireducens]